MTQNIYDDPDFFAGYCRLGRSVDGLDGAAEWPSLRAMLPDMRGLRVLDLGCGFGWFCRWARENGASRVAGVDVSENMLARARAATSDPAIIYQHADLERLDLTGETFDLAYSSLALHYIEYLEPLLAKVQVALTPGGLLVFSVEHPVYTAPGHPGWITDANGRKTWPVDGYLIEGKRTTNWLTGGVIKWHRTLATWFRVLSGSGFSVTQMEEWGPHDEQIAARPDLADERQRPPFLLIAARRAG